jgi:hypothetical protein
MMHQAVGLAGLTTFVRIIPMKELTYLELVLALHELTPEQLHQPVRVAVGRKLLPVYDTVLSCECNGGARVLVGENYPLLIGNKMQE